MKPSVQDAIAFRLVLASIAEKIAADPAPAKTPAPTPAPAQPAQQPAQPKKKKLAVFDFDDTLVSSEGSVGVTHSDGQHDVLDSHDFALYKSAHGDTLDFTDFNDVKKPRKIKKGFDAIKAAAADPDTRVVILTARPKGAASAVKKFMSEEGLDNVEAVALQSSDPMSKADWISDEVQKNGHSEVTFMDDSSKNADAVKTIDGKHAGVKLTVTNPPLPTETDYDGPQMDKHYVSDNPTRAVAVIDKKKGVQPVPGQHSSSPAPAKPQQPQKGAPAQPAQQQPAQGQQPAQQPAQGQGQQPAQGQPDKSLEAPAEEKDKPDKSDMEWWNVQSPEFKKRYLQKHPDSKFKGASLKGASAMPTESNQTLKDFIYKNWKKTGNKKVEKYLEDDFWEKLDSMGDFAGHWLEQLEAKFEKLAKPPRGLLADFEEQDFDDLFFSLFGNKRRK